MWVFEENFKSNDYVWNSVPTYAGLLRKRFKVGFPIRKILKIFENCMKYSRSVERKIDLAVNKAWPAGWLNLILLLKGSRILEFKGVLHPLLKISMFVCYLKIINFFEK